MTNSDEEDRFDKLSDEILILIISHLTLREATATSILSSRWRYLHMYTTRLDFPPFKSPARYPHYNIEEDKVRQKKKVPPYINMINHVIDSHKGGRVIEFRAHLPCLDGADIERWLEFAISRRVEILEMKMHCLKRYRRSPGLSNLISPLPGHGHLGCLKKLFLSVIHVDDGEVQLLLSKFPLLESLSIENSDALRNVVIADPSLLLKHLNISKALFLEYLEIGDMINLVSLRCHLLAHPYVLQLYNVPKLIELSMGDSYGTTLPQVLPGIPRCIFDQLRMLKLSTAPGCMRGRLEEHPFLPAYRVPQLKNIKNLEITIRMCYYYNNTFEFLPLIEACPSLEVLKIEFWWFLDIIKMAKEEIEEINNVRSADKKLSQYLKKLKLTGYTGFLSQFKMVLYILKNAVAIEELIVQTCDESRPVRRIAEIRASHHLRSVISDSVSLVII